LFGESPGGAILFSFGTFPKILKNCLAIFGTPKIERFSSVFGKALLRIIFHKKS